MKQGTDIAVFKHPLGPEGDFDRLVAIGGNRAAVVAVLGNVDDPKVDLGLGDGPPAVSRAAHPGSQNILRRFPRISFSCETPRAKLPGVLPFPPPFPPKGLDIT